MARLLFAARPALCEIYNLWRNVMTDFDFNTPVDLSRTTGNPPVLTQSYAIGQGIDVFGMANPRSFITPLLDPNKTKFKKFTFLGKDFMVPSYVMPIEDPSGYYQGGTYMSREEFQNSVATSTGASIGYGLFSGEMKATYDYEYTSSYDYAYAYSNYYSKLASLHLNDPNGCLADRFAEMVKNLPNVVTPDNLDEFISFFNNYGIYYVSSIELGAKFEYYVSVTKSSQLSRTEISAMLSAQINGLIKSGSISAEVTASKEWKKYVESTRYHIRVTGGDPSLAGALANVNPLEPSQSTVSAYEQWLKSSSSSPAIINLKLRGIWDLCGDKSKVVNEAWIRFSESVHPKITIESKSKVTVWPIPEQVYVTPIITINGKGIKPASPPLSPVGFQAIILSNNGNVPDVLYNKYFSLDSSSVSWMSNNYYPKLYQTMTEELYKSEFNQKNNLLILCSFGLGANLCPTPPFYEYLKLNGAGARLEYWEKNCDPGSQMGNHDYWMVSPVNYILASLLGNGPNVGIELYERSSSYVESINSQLLIYLFKDSLNGKYTLGS